MKKIVVTGGEGQVALAMKHHPKASAFNLHFLNRAACDITDPQSISTVLDEIQPDLVINTAAYTAVDQAESEPEIAMRINADGAKHVAEACEKHRVRLIHLSTDYVFDGESTTPITEDHPTYPINVYGESKCLGEIAIRDTLENHLILRVSGVFSEFKTNFLKTILRLARERETLSVVNDQFTCPTDAHSIADTLYTLALAEPRCGTYHFASTPPVSWFQFAASVIGGTCEHNLPLKTHTMKKITSAEYPTAAKRPRYSVLNADRLRNDFGIEQPDWHAGIQRVLNILLKETI